MNQPSFADLLKDLAAQYNAGRLTFEQFRSLRRALLRDAEAQYLAPPPPPFGDHYTPPANDDITVVPPPG
jgi:hypothetical protein